MPLNQKGSRVFAGTGSGYTETYLKSKVKRKSKSPKEKKALKQAMKKREQHKVTVRAAFKLRSPRI